MTSRVFECHTRFVGPVRKHATDSAAPARTSGWKVTALTAVLLVPIAGAAEPPARIHGDLWRGNVLAGVDGTPWVIDPAAHGGHRETDLAMMRLFGGFGPRAYPAYCEAFPLAAGHEERVALHQLHPLLVHAALFGSGYGEQAVAAARRYA